MTCRSSSLESSKVLIISIQTEYETHWNLKSRRLYVKQDPEILQSTRDMWNSFGNSKQNSHSSPTTIETHQSSDSDKRHNQISSHLSQHLHRLSHPGPGSEPTIIRTHRHDAGILVRSDLLDLDRLTVLGGARLLLEQLRNPVAASVMDNDLFANAHLAVEGTLKFFSRV